MNNENNVLQVNSNVPAQKGNSGKTMANSPVQEANSRRSSPMYLHSSTLAHFIRRTLYVSW